MRDCRTAVGSGEGNVLVALAVAAALGLWRSCLWEGGAAACGS
jgi:hypothetical protein